MPEPKSSLPVVELTALDHRAMEGMSEQQRKLYVMRKQVRVFREGGLFNRRALKNPNSSMAYNWVNIKEERRVFFESQGWQLCQDSKVGSNYWKEDEKQHRCADLVLYEIPKELYEVMEAYAVVRGLERTDAGAAEDSFAAAMRQVGVVAPTFQPKV